MAQPFYHFPSLNTNISLTYLPRLPFHEVYVPYHLSDSFLMTSSPFKMSSYSIYQMSFKCMPFLLIVYFSCVVLCTTIYREKQWWIVNFNFKVIKHNFNVSYLFCLDNIWSWFIHNPSCHHLSSSTMFSWVAKAL